MHAKIMAPLFQRVYGYLRKDGMAGSSSDVSRSRESCNGLAKIGG
jgi:hypothetical protein